MQKEALDFRLQYISKYQVPCFSHSRIFITYVNWWSWGSSVCGAQDWVRLFLMTSCAVSSKWVPVPRPPEDCCEGHSVLCERKAVFHTGFSWKRWHAIHRCQLLVTPATGFDLCSHFSCLILLIKESLFSITLNQDLFIVQETIKTLMGHDWPCLPLWPYLSTACAQHLCCVKLLPGPLKPTAFSLRGLGTGCTPLPGFADTCWSSGAQMSSPFCQGVFLQAFYPGVYLS